MQQRVSVCLQCLQVPGLEWEQQISCTVWLLFDGLERADGSCRSSCGCSRSALRSVPAFALIVAFCTQALSSRGRGWVDYHLCAVEPQKGWCQVPPRAVCAGDGLRAAVLVWIPTLSADYFLLAGSCSAMDEVRMEGNAALFPWLQTKQGYLVLCVRADWEVPLSFFAG